MLDQQNEDKFRTQGTYAYSAAFCSAGGYRLTADSSLLDNKMLTVQPGVDLLIVFHCTTKHDGNVKQELAVRGNLMADLSFVIAIYPKQRCI